MVYGQLFYDLCSIVYGLWSMVYVLRSIVYCLCGVIIVLWSMFYGLSPIVILSLCYDHCSMVYVLWYMVYVLWSMCYDHCSMVYVLWYMVYVLCSIVHVLWSLFYVLWSMACMFDVLEFGLFDVLIDLYSSSDIPARGAPKTFLQKFHKMRFPPKNEYYLWWHFRIYVPLNSLRKYETNGFIATLISLISLECLSKLSTALQPYLYIWYSIHILLS